MKLFPPAAITLLSTTLMSTAAAEPCAHGWTTIADARTSKARGVDLGEPGDSTGDLLTFDQPLLNETGEPIGTNSGFCVRTRIGHSYQCQWTLSLPDGTIQVAGREFDEGATMIPIVGGTGAYAGAAGEMRTVNNGDGTFTQTLYLDNNRQTTGNR
ncbi:MAG: dirigent protein [Gammaproteobacteria bacterium]|nr:dirigent protein [Gammaproteobacteria bacterium]